MVMIADWVLHAYETQTRPETRRFRNLEQKIFAQAMKDGFDDLVTYDEGLEEYFPSRELEMDQQWNDFVEDFAMTSFFDNLIDMLAGRDLSEQIGPSVLAEMPREEIEEKRNELLNKYVLALKEKGISAVRVEGI